MCLQVISSFSYISKRVKNGTFENRKFECYCLAVGMRIRFNKDENYILVKSIAEWHNVKINALRFSSLFIEFFFSYVLFVSVYLDSRSPFDFHMDLAFKTTKITSHTLSLVKIPPEKKYMNVLITAKKKTHPAICWCKSRAHILNCNFIGA